MRSSWCQQSIHEGYTVSACEGGRRGRSGGPNFEQGGRRYLKDEDAAAEVRQLAASPCQRSQVVVNMHVSRRRICCDAKSSGVEWHGITM